MGIKRKKHNVKICFYSDRYQLIFVKVISQKTSYLFKINFIFAVLRIDKYFNILSEFFKGRKEYRFEKSIRILSVSISINNKLRQTKRDGYSKV